MRLTREHRVRKTAEYKRLAGCSARVRSPHFTVWVHRKESGPFRMGMAVSRRVGKAVDRNRLRRRLREVVRHEGDRQESLDLVFVARPGAAELEFKDLQTEIAELMQRSRRKAARR